MILIHLSDLHLSQYGETGTWTKRDEKKDQHWDVLQVWQRWQIEGRRDRKGRPDNLRLVDPYGVIHKVRGWPAKNDDKAIAHLLTIAMKRHQTSAEKLSKERPSPEDLKALLQVDPLNTNLRFIKLVDQINSVGPELILLTGDITDNGFGYGLVEHYLEPWIQEQLLFVIPGNHDTYDMLPRFGRRARTNLREEHYMEFAQRIGMEPEGPGAYVRYYKDLAIVGLNSCKMPRTPLSASGAVSREQLDWLHHLGREEEFSQARLRLCLVHHHLIRMPFSVGKRTPIEVGMRLRNAEEVIRVCMEVRMNMIFNGHRHHGYLVQLPGRPMIISAPSSTLGCKSWTRTYFWRMNLTDHYPFPRVHKFS